MPVTATALQISDEPILLRQDTGGIATVTLNRPKQFNALSEELLTGLPRSGRGSRNGTAKYGQETSHART